VPEFRCAASIFTARFRTKDAGSQCFGPARTAYRDGRSSAIGLPVPNHSPDRLLKLAVAFPAIGLFLPHLMSR